MQNIEEASGICDRPSNLRPEDFETYEPNFQEPGYEDHLLEFPDDANADPMLNLVAGFSSMNTFTNDETGIEFDSSNNSEFEDDGSGSDFEDADNGVTFYVEEASNDNDEEEPEEFMPIDVVTQDPTIVSTNHLSTNVIANLNMISPMASPERRNVSDQWTKTQSAKRNVGGRRFSRTASESGTQMLTMSEEPINILEQTLEVDEDDEDDDETDSLDGITWENSPVEFQSLGFTNIDEQMIEPQDYLQTNIFDQEQLEPIEHGRMCPVPSFDFEEESDSSVWSVDDAMTSSTLQESSDFVSALQEPSEFVSELYENIESESNLGRHCPSPSFDLIDGAAEVETNDEETFILSQVPSFQEPEDYSNNNSGGIPDEDALFDDANDAIERGRDCPSPSFDLQDDVDFNDAVVHRGRRNPTPTFDMESSASPTRNNAQALANITNKIIITSADSPATTTTTKLSQTNTPISNIASFNENSSKKATPIFINDLRKLTMRNLMGKNSEPNKKTEERVTPAPDDCASPADELTPGIGMLSKPQQQSQANGGVPRRILAFSTPKASPSIL